MRVFIGGYGPYLYMAWLDPESGSLDLVDSVTTPANASFLAYSSQYETLYGTVETTSRAKGPGKLVAYRVDEASKLTTIGAVTSCGDAPCHVAVSEVHGIVAVANYAGGSVGIISIHSDGTPGELLRCFEHSGSGPDLKRQEQPHPHAVVIAPDGEHLYVCDLGTDEIRAYSPLADPAGMTSVRAAELAPGSGPRHLLFWERQAYVVNELSNTVCVFDVDPESGELRQIQEESTLPPDYSAGNLAAEIAVHPTGRFLYVSNRGHDSIAVFARDAASGKLTLSGHFDVTGPAPRHFAIDPSGTWCVVAVHDGNYVSSFALDPKTGVGRYTDSVVRITAPSCVVFPD